METQAMPYPRTARTILGFLVLALVACTAAPTGSGQTGPRAESAGADQVQLKDEIVVRLWDNPQGFDPATLFRVETENVAFNLYSGLTTYEPNTGEVIPDVAERWDTSDARVWTFHLRRGVQWQAGYGELTARDVLYSYNRVLDPATASPYRNEFANVEEFSAPDDYTVVIRLKTADGNFPHQVASYHQGQIVKQEAVEKFGDQYAMNPVGTGAFFMERFVPNSEIILTRHDGYYKGPSKLRKVTYRIIKDESTTEVALKNREVDLGRQNLDEALDRLQKDDRFTLYSTEGNAVGVLIFNLEYEPFSKVAVRQAVAHAIDWTAIIKASGPLTSSAVVSFVPSWMSIYTSDVPKYAFDPGRSRALLREAGYPDGFSFRCMRSSAGGGPTDEDLLVQDFLARVGIKLDFELVETTVYNQRRNRGDFQMTSRNLPAVNPDQVLFSYLHPSNMAPRGLNGARYDNPTLTAMLEQGRAESNPATRLTLYHDVQRIAMTDLPYLPRLTSKTYWPAWKAVKGVAINKLTNVDFWPVTVDAR
jgi:ABC-type transport system substrate-binding protein